MFDKMKVRRGMSSGMMVWPGLKDVKRGAGSISMIASLVTEEEETLMSEPVDILFVFLIDIDDRS